MKILSCIRKTIIVLGIYGIVALIVILSAQRIQKFEEVSLFNTNNSVTIFSE